MTKALEGGEGSVSHSSRSLPPGKTQYPLYSRLDGPQGQSGQVQKISPPPGFDPWTVQPVASHYTNYATRPMTVLLNTRKTLYCWCAFETMSLNNLRNTYLEHKVLNFNAAYSKRICSNTTGRTDGRNEECVWYLQSLASLTRCCV
jgi:hypothetical protein